MRIDTSLGAASNPLSIAVPLIKRFEGCRLNPYLCSAGVPTCGFGSTLYEDGTKVTLKDKPITMERAESLLMLTLQRDYLPSVRKLCPVPLSPNQVAALVSFVYNVGSNALKNSTLRKKILAQLWDEVPEQILKWNKAAGKESKGLNSRRQAEAFLFSS